jgi:acyl-[acyl-carrier-protein] desaturase
MGIAPTGRLGNCEQIEVLASMEDAVRAGIDAHLQRRNLWFPNDHLPADADGAEEREATLRQLRTAARDLPDGVRVSLALNLLTEEGLPHFHRLIALYFGMESPWSTWNNMWTAEEDRHGCALRDYVRDAGVFNMRKLEEAQYRYIENGFDPAWDGDPYRLLAYTSLQERATQMSHAATSRLAAEREPILQRVLAHLASDEMRHFHFYRDMFAEILRRDPQRALVSLQKVSFNFDMPGHLMPGFADMSEVVRRLDVFGPAQYRRVLSELLEHWQIGRITGLSGEAARAQEKLMQAPQRLARVADYVASKTQPRIFRFDFIGEREIRL